MHACTPVREDLDLARDHERVGERKKRVELSEQENMTRFYTRSVPAILRATIKSQHMRVRDKNHMNTRSPIAFAEHIICFSNCITLHAGHS